MSGISGWLVENLESLVTWLSGVIAAIFGALLWGYRKLMTITQLQSKTEEMEKEISTAIEKVNILHMDFQKQNLAHARMEERMKSIESKLSENNASLNNIRDLIINLKNK